MKKTYLLIAVGIVMIIVALININLDIEVKGHFFGNGVVFGVGISLIVAQVLKMRKAK